MAENLAPFPVIANASGPPDDGTIIKAPRYCQKADRAKCGEFYAFIRGTPGIYTCPYGYSALVSPSGGDTVVFSGLKIEGKFDRHKVGARNDNSYSPRIPLEVAQSAAKQYISQLRIQDKNVELTEFINSTIHEVRKLNGDIKAQMDEAGQELKKKAGANLDFVAYRIENAFATSMLVTTRLDFYDYQSNPEIVTAGRMVPTPIYKKFQKTMHCLRAGAKQNGVTIAITGSCTATIEAYKIFELLPVVLIENAVKFAPKGTQIDIEFLDTRPVIVEISSLGPLLDDGEEIRVFEKGYRGNHAKKLTSGTGIGLNFAKWICDLHRVTISVKSDRGRITNLSGVPNAPFAVRLKFPE